MSVSFVLPDCLKLGALLLMRGASKDFATCGKYPYGDCCGWTMMRADSVHRPPAPCAESVYVDVTVGCMVRVPLGATCPRSEMKSDVA